jgi:hypothetical protein
MVGATGRGYTSRSGESLGNLGQSKRVLTPITPEGWEIAAIATVIGENTVKLLETFL